MACIFCQQSPHQAPWGMFATSGGSAEVPTPMGELCYQCLDTLRSRWPFKSVEDLTADGKTDARFRAQVMHLTKVKLGSEAKNFLAQDVAETAEIGVRWEQPAIPMTAEAFQSEFGRAPDAVPGVIISSITDQTGASQKRVSVRDEPFEPRIVLWHETRLTLSEVMFNRSTHFATGQGSEIFAALLPKLATQGAAMSPPTKGQLRDLTLRAAVAGVSRDG